MKGTILKAYAGLFIAVLLMYVSKLQQEEAPAAETYSPAPPAEAQIEEPEQTLLPAAEPAPETIRVLINGETVTMDMQDYLIGVVAAEMPATFEPEALKAQAVAARTYAIYNAKANKHGEAQVCGDFACCQAWHSGETLHQNWGDDYEHYYRKIEAAVEETHGQYLSYQGQAVFAAFHSSSAGATADCGQVWNPLPYLVSVSSPETAAEVPNYVSTVSCSALDFRDTLLYAHPEADFTGEETDWIGRIERDESGRVSTAVLGGVPVRGTELRSLFSLRSTAFRLDYSEGVFTFTVTGYGHGVGMSQYGAKVMAQKGETYAAILAHYYPGTSLVS